MARRSARRGRNWRQHAALVPAAAEGQAHHHQRYSTQRSRTHRQFQLLFVTFTCFVFHSYFYFLPSFLPSFFSFFLWVFCEVFLLVIFSGWSFGGFSHVSPIPFLGWSVLIDWLVFQSIYRLVSFEFWPLFSLFHIADFRVSLIWWNWFEICSLFNFFFRRVVEIDFYDWFLGQYFGVELVIFDQVWVFISFRLLANLWLFWPISGSFLDPLKIPIQFWFYFLIQYQSVFFNGSVSISWSNSFWLVFSRILVPSFWLFLTNFHLILLQVFEASNAIFRLILIDFQTNFVVDLDGTFKVLRLSLGQFE